MTEVRPEAPTLLVQCCHLPQFIFLAEKLSRKTGQQLDALVVDHPHVAFYLKRFPIFRKVYFFKKRLPELEDEYKEVVFPLLNRGYLGIKRAASSIDASRLNSDYDGNFQPLTTQALLSSSVRALHPVTDEFVAYLKDFPHRPLGKKILFLDSCHASLIEQSRDIWERVIPERADVRRLSQFSFSSLRDLRSEKFDAAVVFLSGESEFFKLKLLPFLLRIKEVVIINENANYFYANSRSLIRFFYQRVRHGSALPTQQPLILFVQTESTEYVAHALKKLEEEELFPDSEVVLFCREDDREELEACPQVSRVITFTKGLKSQNLQSWRELQKLSPDIVASIFSGRSVFRKQKILFLRFWDRPQLIFNAALNCYWLKLRTLPRILKKDELQFKRAELVGTKALMVQTEDWRYIGQAIRELRDKSLFPGAEVAVLAREEDRKRFESLEGVSRVFGYSKARDIWGARKEVRDYSPDLVSAVFSGRRSFWKQKLFFLLQWRRPQLVFNPALDCFWLSLRSLPKVFRYTALQFQRPDFVKTKVLLIQTEACRYVEAAIQKLKGEDLYPGAEITVVCREADSNTLQGLPGVSNVIPFSKKSGLLDVSRKIKEFGPEVVSAIFSGRGVFRKQKLLFFRYFRLPKLAFNARLDAYEMTWRTFPRIFKQEPLLFEDSQADLDEILLIQTESDGETLQAVKTLLSGKVVPNEKISVLCREDKKEVFGSLPAVERVYTYKAGKFFANLGTLKELIRTNRDVVGALFTGRPIYRFQKFLFFLLPARNRLVFNENQDCFYLKRGRFARLFRLPSLFQAVTSGSHMAGTFHYLRQAAKAILFIPRFIYLLSWITVMKLKRSYVLGKKTT